MNGTLPVFDGSGLVGPSRSAIVPVRELAPPADVDLVAVDPPLSDALERSLRGVTLTACEGLVVCLVDTAGHLAPGRTVALFVAGTTVVDATLLGRFGLLALGKSFADALPQGGGADAQGIDEELVDLHLGVFVDDVERCPIFRKVVFVPRPVLVVAPTVAVHLGRPNGSPERSNGVLGVEALDVDVPAEVDLLTDAGVAIGQRAQVGLVVAVVIEPRAERIRVEVDLLRTNALNGHVRVTSFR